MTAFIPSPRHLHLVGAFDFPDSPCDIEPIDTLSDPIVGEFSELGREPMGWMGVLAICMAIGVPLILAWELFHHG